MNVDCNVHIYHMISGIINIILWLHRTIGGEEVAASPQPPGVRVRHASL